MMSDFEKVYLDMVDQVITKGEYRECRNGETRALFDQSLVIKELKYDMFPILTSRKIWYTSIFGELAAFLRGATKIKEFHEWGCRYWDNNAVVWPPNHGLNIEEMSVGAVYGAQWVNWGGTGINQLEALVQNLYADPHSRRHLLYSMAPGAESCLPPCHLLAQFFVHTNGELDCTVYMRSVDIIHGLPADVVLYATLLILVANHVSLMPGTLRFHLGDTHIYENHVDLYIANQQEAKTYAPPSYKLAPTDVFHFVPLHMALKNYQFSPAITYPFNV
jgi:thymidylate synthase